jgi:glucan 1,3-beta-glucosidase
MFDAKIIPVILAIGIAFIAGFFANTALAVSCDANSTEPNFFVYGICFSPFKDGQKFSDFISVEQIKERLAAITKKRHTQWIRTYGSTNGLEEIPAEANKLGLKVAMGTWIRDGNEMEIDNLVAKAQLGLVDIAVVGNEELYHGTSDANMINKINDVRQHLADVNCAYIPVAIAEPFNTLFTLDGRGNSTLIHPSVINAVDVIFVNIYSFHQGIFINNALADVILKYQSAVNAVNDSNKQVIIGETGWASGGLTKIDAEPSLENLARYFSDVSQWSSDNNVPLFYFEAFDEKCKDEEKWREDPNYLYTIAEKYWGIWDSNGLLKSSFIKEPVLCENFDPPVNTFYPRREWEWESKAPDPNIMAGDSSSDGNFLRLLYDNTGTTQLSSVAFDRVEVGIFPRVVAEFDFRLYGPDVNDDADGFSFMLIPTLLNGTNGCSKYSAAGFAEKPKLSKTFAVGFKIYEWPPGQPCNNIYISWDGRWLPNEQPIQIPVDDVDLDSGNWHHAKIDLRAFDTDKAMVTVILTPNIRLPDPCEPIIIVENLEIDDPNHPYEPYENRVEFAGRNGGLDINADIDNICVRYKPGICDGLAGDVNRDCKIDFLDLAAMANDWLVNCNLIPDYAACVAR